MRLNRLYRLMTVTAVVYKYGLAEALLSTVFCHFTL